MDKESNKLTENFQLGVSDGLLHAAGYLMKKAQVEFMEGKDGIAQVLRSYARELDRKAGEALPRKK